MKIISWNIKGLNNPHKKDMVRNMIRDNKLDIVLIQDTKMPKDKVEILFFFSSGKKLGSDVDGASSGMAIIWNDKIIHGELLYQSRNMINVIFLNNKDNTSWVQTNVYAPNTKWGRKSCWIETTYHRRDFADEDWVSMGISTHL